MKHRKHLLLGVLLPLLPATLALTCAETLLQPRIEIVTESLLTLSPDGTVAGGAGFWTDVGVQLELPNSFEIFVTGISNHGDVIVGSNFQRWENGVTTQLPTWTNDPQGEIEDVSADGLVAVGYVYDAPGTGVHASMWIDGVEIPITGEDGFEAYLADAVSEDGETILVRGGFPDGPGGRYLWRAGAVTEIPAHPDATSLGTTSVDCLSDDGTTVVLTDSFESDPVVGTTNRAFRWREGVLEPLGNLPNAAHPTAQAFGVTRNGEVVVGWGFGASRMEAMIWDATHGMRSLEALLLELGVSFPDGVHPEIAFDISGDGRRIVGAGTRSYRFDVSFVVTLPPACADGLDNDSDGLTDWPEDSQCGLRLDLSESE